MVCYTALVRDFIEKAYILQSISIGGLTKYAPPCDISWYSGRLLYMDHATMSAEVIDQALKVVSRTDRLIRWFISEVRWSVRVVLSSADRFYWDNGFSKAAALAYTTLLSLVPITALCFGILAAFIQSGDHKEIQEFLFRQFIPGSNSMPDLFPYLQEFSVNLRALNIVVIASLVVTSLLLINSIEYALNQVWQVYEPRSIADRIAIFCAIIVIAPVLAVSGYYTTTKVEPMFAGNDLLNGTYHESLPFLIDFISFMTLYYLVPKAPVKVTSAVYGAVVASVLFGWAKHGFAFYILTFSSYETVYGIASSIPIFLFWLYISWTVVLFGAEISYQAQYLPRFGKLWKGNVMTVGDGAMLLATETLVLMARAFRAGTKLPNELEVAEQLGCSSVVLKPALDALEKEDIIMRGDGRDMPLVLMRSPETITMANVRDAIFKKRQCLVFGAEMMKVFGCFSKGQDPSKMSLADVEKGQ